MSIDSGMMHALLNLQTMIELESHPKGGASWEGFVIEQLMHILKAEPEECFFSATHAGAELELLVVRGSERKGCEIQRTSTPKATPSMHLALNDLKLSALDVVHAGEHTLGLHERIRAVSVNRLLDDIEPYQLSVIVSPEVVAVHRGSRE
jgi:predicted AAA+ superfamily ATPase